MAEINESEFSDYNVTVFANRSDVVYTDSAISTLYHVIWYVVLVLGVPGNVLSAIVWLRRRVAANNSSAVYLAALAINDLAFLPFYLLDSIICNYSSWLCGLWLYLLTSAFTLEPLLVLSFSVERLIAILRPLQVCCMLFSVVTKALDAETETKTEAVYLKTEAEAQGSWPILLTVLSSIQLRKIKLNHRYMMFTCNAAAFHSLWA